QVPTSTFIPTPINIHSHLDTQIIHSPTIFYFSLILSMALLPLLLLFQLQHVLTESTSTSPSHTVIVVGAGMSGIMAAKTLDDAGIKDVVILEATLRVGGRMKKADFGGHTVELGANWYQSGGPVFNPIADLVNKLNLNSSLSDFNNVTSNTYKQKGGLYPQELVEATDKVATKRDDFCLNLTNVLNSNQDISILAAHRLFGQTPEKPLEMLIDYYHHDFGDAEPPRLTSLKSCFPLWETTDHGDNARFVCDARGFKVIAQFLGKQFLSAPDNQPRLHLNQVVRKIMYNETNVEVITEDGKRYKAEYVIVSASVGVLQTDLIQFNPILPMWKRIAIADFSMAVYTKIFLKFPYKFWPTGPGTEFFFYTHNRRGYYPIWQHLENEYPGSNILIVTVTHDESRRIEKLRDEAIMVEAISVLRKMFGEDIPEAESIMVPRWWSDRFYKGSYSNWHDGYTNERHKHLKVSSKYQFF
ncbi:Polyamine oxidase 1, partial [Linum perenne]